MKTLALFAALSLPFISDCAHAPRAGDECQEGKATCSSKSTSLMCVGGKYVETGCRGPKGCSVDNDQVLSCDQSLGAKAGELCADKAGTITGQMQCQVDDPSRYLTCAEGRWNSLACAKGASCVLRDVDGSTMVVCEGKPVFRDAGQ